ncbi:MAG TPA: ChbG/HpnK family deacetylase [Bryobacteraceae bacterium]|nr:ChbG/HpnK family deacetylase [Bryobacteraceae bacterium]
MKYLITNADDFGFTRDVNQGILEAHRNGILTATTLMATGAAFQHAVELARENPTLDVGVHLVLVGAEGFPETVARLMGAIALGRIRIYDRLASQVRQILDAGLRPTHLDTHKHTHLLPPVMDAVARIAEEFGIAWVRRPLDAPIPFLRTWLNSTLRRHGCRTTHHFAGFEMTGNYDARQLAALIRGLREGVTEFMCHPGLCTPELQAARTRLKESRQRELEALKSPEVKAAVETARVALVRYCDLSTT